MTNLTYKKFIKLAIMSCLAVATFASYQVFASQTASAYMTANRYNLIGQETGVISPKVKTTYPASRMTYGIRGLLLKIENGYLTTWQNETIRPVNWTGFVVSVQQRFTYNNYGWKDTQITYSNDGIDYLLTQYSYDVFGRVKCIAVRMSTASYGSLPASACILGSEGLDGPDRITRYSYNKLDQIITEERAVGTTLAQVYQKYEYDIAGRVTFITDANGNRAHMAYDAHGRLEYWYYPDKTNVGSGGYNSSDFEQYTYDANGNRSQLRKRDGRKINYQYDNLNQVIKKDWPNTTVKDVYYDYDLRGIELHARYGSDTGLGIVRKFDGFGRQKIESNNSSGKNYSITYRYDDNSNRTRVTHPDGNFFEYGYDGLDRLETIRENSISSAVLLTQVYDNYSRLKSINRSNTANSILGYDNMSRVNALSHDFRATNDDIDFDFGYNAASQLTSLTLSNNMYHHTRAVVGETGSYTVNGLNQYTRVNGKTITNDSNGNLLFDGDFSYFYDVENRLISTTKNNTLITYDPLGRLNRLTSDGTTKTFIYDGDALIAEYIGNNIVNRYIHGNGIDSPLVSYHGSNVSSLNRQFLHTNHQGSIVAASTSVGSMSYINVYDSYGVPSTINQGRFGYTGQLNLSEIGLNYYKARIYHPKLGRFLQTDPIGYEDQMNLYAYVGNDPVNMTDPSGECGGGWCVATVAAVVKLVPKIIKAYKKYKSNRRIKKITRNKEISGKKNDLSSKNGTNDLDSDFNTLTKGSNVKTYENGTKVGKLPDGRKVDQHASRGKSGKGSNVKKGTQSIKIKNESGKRTQTTIRYPKDKI